MPEVYRILEDKIRRVCIRIERYAELFRRSEENVKVSLIFPILTALGWDVQEPDQVTLETSTENGGRIDIVLKKDGRKVFLIEVKNLSRNLNNYLEQVGRYIFSEGIPYGAISNGKNWVFIKAWSEGQPLSNRILTQLDICEFNIVKIISTFICLSPNDIQNFEQCLKRNMNFLHHSFDFFESNLNTCFDCSFTEDLQNFICSKIKDEIVNLIKSFREEIAISNNYLISTPDDSDIQEGQDETTNNQGYKVKLNGIFITANSRLELLKKVIETSFLNQWFTLEDLPIRLHSDHHNFIELVQTEDSLPNNDNTSIILQINNTKLRIKTGTSGQSHKTKIKKFLRFLTEQKGIETEIINL